MKKNIAIIDYKMSNLHSIKSALNKVNLNSEITSNEKDLLEADCIILPGVGSFKSAMSYIKKYEIDRSIFKFLETGKPLICVCLGMQLLFESSREFGFCEGLKIFKGEVIKLNFTNKKIPIPHVGWNNIEKTNNSDNILLESLKNNEMMYFVHSYYAVPKDNMLVSTFTEYGGLKFCSSLNYRNIYAFQFHPEKSSNLGLRIYKNIEKII